MKNVSAFAAFAAFVVVEATQAAGVPGQGTWETTLLGRDITGSAVAASDATAVFLYDTTLSVTWLRDANVNGAMPWGIANTWANGLVVGAFSGWRLPMMVSPTPTNCSDFFVGGADCGYNVRTKSGDPTKYEAGQTVYSEMAQLWYVELGNKAPYEPGTGLPQGGAGLTNTGNFQNLGSFYYWYGVEWATDRTYAWTLKADDGFQWGYSAQSFATAVRPGDVLTAIPEPQSLAMMLAGLGVVVGAVRRRRRD